MELHDQASATLNRSTYCSGYPNTGSPPQKTRVAPSPLLNRAKSGTDNSTNWSLDPKLEVKSPRNNQRGIVAQVWMCGAPLPLVWPLVNWGGGLNSWHAGSLAGSSPATWSQVVLGSGR